MDDGGTHGVMMPLTAVIAAVLVTRISTSPSAAWWYLVLGTW